MTTAHLLILFLVITITTAWDIDDNVSKLKQIKILIVANEGRQHDISVINKYLSEKNEIDVLYPEDDLCILLEELLLHHVSGVNPDNYIMFVDNMQKVSPILNKQCVFFKEISMTHYIVDERETKIIQLQYTYPNQDRKSSRHLLAANYSGWIAPLPLLPRDAIQSAIAYYDNHIFIIGGDPTKQQVVQIDYNTQQQTFSITDHGNNILGVNVYGNSQHYTQQNEMLYLIDSDAGNIIRRYNLATLTIDSNFQLTITTNPGTEGCIESNENYLFIIGGGIAPLSSLNNLQIYNILSNEWVQGPMMKTQRRSHACVINEITNELYAIAGKLSSQTDYVNSIEKIPLNDIMNQNWNYIDSLTYPTISLRAVSYEDSILVIGGRYFDNGGVGFGIRKQIQVINCITGSVSNAGYLNYQVYDTAAIYIKDMHMIYAFGGHNGVSFLDTWQYIQLKDTDAPTVLPTVSPTDISIVPTSAPIYAPTSAPIYAPTTAPIYTPTSAPSNELHGVYIDIEFEYDLDMNTTKIIEIIIDSLVNETVNYECILSIVNNATNVQSMSTNIGVKIFVCDEESKVNLVAVFSNNLESDLITKINENDEIQLEVSVNMINIVLNGERIDNVFYNNTIITSTGTRYFYGNLNENKDDKLLIWIIIATGGSLILIFFVAFCIFWRFKYQRKMKDLEVSDILAKSQTATSMGVTAYENNNPVQIGESNDKTDLELNEGEIEEMYTSEINLTETPTMSGISTTKGTPTMSGISTAKGHEIITNCGDV